MPTLRNTSLCSRDIVIRNVTQQGAGGVVSSPTNLSLSHVVFLQSEDGHVVDIAEFLPAPPVIRCVSPASVAQYCNRTSRSSLQCALDGDTVQGRHLVT